MRGTAARPAASPAEGPGRECRWTAGPREGRGSPGGSGPRPAAAPRGGAPGPAAPRPLRREGPAEPPPPARPAAQRGPRPAACPAPRLRGRVFPAGASPSIPQPGRAGLGPAPRDRGAERGRSSRGAAGTARSPARDRPRWMARSSERGRPAKPRRDWERLEGLPGPQRQPGALRGSTESAVPPPHGSPPAPCNRTGQTGRSPGARASRGRASRPREPALTSAALLVPARRPGGVSGSLP